MTTEDLWEEEQKVRDILGAEDLLDNLEKAIGRYTLENMLAYICRCYDIETKCKEK